MAVKALAAITLMHTTDGQSVASIGAQYYVSTSKTTQAGGSWSDSFPAWQANHYLWIRQKITYKTPAKTEYTTPFVDTSWEKVNEVSSQLVEVSTRLTGAETSIQKNKQAIDLKASTSYVTESTNKAVTAAKSYTDAQLKLSATNLTLSFSQNYETKDDAATSSTNLSDAFQTALDTTQKDLAESAATQYSSLKGQIDQYNEYFDFSKDGLVIGKTGSPVKLREENDKIAFTANGQDLMYLKSGVLNISEVDIKSVLKLGPLTFRDLGNGRWEIS